MWKCVLSCSVIYNSFPTLWTVACQDPLSMEFSRQEILEWGAISSSSGTSWPRDQPCVSYIGRQILHPEPLGPATKTPGCVGSSNWGAMGAVVVACRLGFPAAHGTFLGRNRTRVPCTGKRILNHWTTREILGLLLYRICHRLGIVLSLSCVLIHSLFPQALWNRFGYDPLFTDKDIESEWQAGPLTQLIIRLLWPGAGLSLGRLALGSVLLVTT